MSDSGSKPPLGGAGGWTRWIMAAVFVGVLVVAAIVVVVTRPGDDEETQPTPPPAPPSVTATQQPSAQPTEPASTDQSCPIASTSNTEVPQDTPDGIEWRSTAYKAMLPYSKTDGPTLEEGPVALCYAHTPTGALMAMSHFYARSRLNPLADERVQVIEQQTLPGADQQEEINGARETASRLWEWRGFRFLSYGDTEARIVGVVTIEGSQHAAVTFVLTWSEDTWMVNLQASNQADSVIVSEAELASYVPWSAEA